MTDLDQACADILHWALSPDAAPVARGEESLPGPIRSLIWTVADAADSSDAQLRSAGINALFPGIVETCNDRLDHPGRDAYAAIFPAVVWRSAQGHEELQARLHTFGVNGERDCYAAYHARRQRCRVEGPPPIIPDIVQRVAVLSRVTIGADILMTTVLCQRLHQAFPGTEIVVIGDGKLSGLLAGLPKVRVEPLRYARRGPLHQRLGAWLELLDCIDELNVDLLVSPDSRLDQLGVMPMSDDETAYLLWENLQPQQGPAQSLATLLDEWCCHVLALEDRKPCVPRVAFAAEYEQQAKHWRQVLSGIPIMGIKLDHGGNVSKALPRAAELRIIRAALDQGWHILLDRGFGDEELENSDGLLRQAGLTALDIDEAAEIGISPLSITQAQAQEAKLIRFHGSIAGWAAALSACDGALSYDSVGHHLAGALGVPVVSMITGFHTPVFPVAWRPGSAAAVTQVVIPNDEQNNESWWQAVIDALPAPAKVGPQH